MARDEQAARTTLFARLKQNTQQVTPPDPSSLLTDLGDIRPALAASTIIDSFIAKATSERLTATVEELAGWSAIPAAVARYQLHNGITASPVTGPDPRLTGLAWGSIEPTQTLEPNTALAVSVADYGIAETGSLVFTSGTETPSLTNYLPLHHIAIVERAKILAYLDDYWRAAGPPDARLVGFITGTSGTADIEGRNVRGAHGPRFLHILILG